MSYDSGYFDDAAQQKKKQNGERAKQRKVIRYQDVSDEEVRKQGGELLAKIVATIPKHFNMSGGVHREVGYKAFYSQKGGVIFRDKKQVIRIRLALRPSAIIDYVVGAFKTKGWGAKHTFNDIHGHDFLDLSLPEDWLKRVLCIGRYNMMVSEPNKEEKIESKHRDETPNHMRFLEKSDESPIHQGFPSPTHEKTELPPHDGV